MSLEAGRAGDLWSLERGRSSGVGDGITLIRLERGMCYGECPVYTISIARSGKVIYDGEHWVQRLGHHVGQWAGDFELLAASVVLLGFFSMDRRYDAPVTDNPTVTTSVIRHHRTRTVENYAGAGPIELWILEQLIDSVIPEVDWDDATGEP